MSRFKVLQLNYISSEKNKTFVNIDLSTQFDVQRSLRILQGIKNAVDGRKNILSEQKTGHEEKRDFISRDTFGDIVSVSADIIINQDHLTPPNLSGISLSSEDDNNKMRMMADNINYTISVEYDGTQIANEKSISSLLLQEEQPFQEDVDGRRQAFRIYTEKDYNRYEQNVKTYIENLNNLRNKTYVIEHTSKGTSEEGRIVNSRKNTIPMYDIQDMCLKSRNEQSKSNVWSFDSSYNTENIYVPQTQENPLQFCQCNGYTYIIQEKSEKDVVQLKSSFQEIRDTAHKSNWYNMYLDCDRMNAVGFYNTPENMVSNVNDPDFTFSHVEFGRHSSVVSKINMNDEYDFINGNDYCDLIQTKSFYNANYDMDSDLLKCDDGNMISSKNCRQYIGIGHFNGNIYLKYNDNTSYVSKYDSIVEHNVSVVTNKKIGYQKIETFLQNQQNIVKNHKSNFFSVRIKNTKFGNYEQYPELKNIQYQQLKKDITNAIRRIVENVSPANTSLIDIQFKD